MRKRYLVLVLAVLLAISGVLVGCSKSESEAVKDSVNGFASAYNAGNYEKCTDYILGVTASTKTDAAVGVEALKAFVQSIEVTNIEDPQIDGSSATAKITVKATLAAVLGGGTSENTRDVPLTKEDGTWKFSLASLVPTSG